MKRHEHGAALILAMLVAALAATVAVALAAEQQRWFAERGGRFLIPIPEPHFVD